MDETISDPRESVIIMCEQGFESSFLIPENQINILLSRSIEFMLTILLK